MTNGAGKHHDEKKPSPKKKPQRAALKPKGTKRQSPS